jgi:hypothetical protein
VSTQAEAILQTVTIEQANELNIRAVEFGANAPILERQALEFTIEDVAGYEFSLTIAEEAIKRQKAIIDFFAGTKKAAHDLHKSICKMESDLLQRYMQIEALVKSRRLKFRQEQEQIRLKAEAEARQAAREAEEKRLLEEAAALEREGEKEAAEVVLQKAQTVEAPAVVIQSSVPKQSGSSVRKGFGFRIDDESLVQREFCSPDEKKIRERVNAYGMAAKISGVTVFHDESEAIRTKR